MLVQSLHYNTSEAIMNQIRVLVVEDEVPTQKAIKHILSREGMSLHTCSNGVEAIEYLKNHSVDLIISDVEMPLMNGVDFLKNLHLRGFYVPTLMITGYGSKSLLQELIRIGCEDFLDKPFSKEDLLESIERITPKTRLIQNAKQNSEENAANFIQALTAIPKDLQEKIHYWSYPLSEIGGDCFFVQRNPKGFCGILADVSGHDMASSYYQVIVKSVFDECTKESEFIQEFSKKLNQTIPQLTHEERMLCALIFQYDEESQILKACTFGNPPFLIQDSNSIQEFPQEFHLPLGLFDQCEIKISEMKLNPQTRISASTDGIINLHKGILGHQKIDVKGISWLKELSQAYSNHSIKEYIQAVKLEAIQHCRNKREDDLMLIAWEV